MNKEINYEMVVIGKPITPHMFNIACDEYKKLNSKGVMGVLATHYGNVCSVTLKQNGKDSNIFSFPIPEGLTDETDLLTLITDDVELSMKPLFDKGTTFNLESLHYYNN